MSIYFKGEGQSVECIEVEVDLLQNGQSMADIIVDAETQIWKGFYGRLHIDGYAQNFTVVEVSMNGGFQKARLISGQATMHHRTRAKQLINVTGKQIIEELCNHKSSGGFDTEDEDTVTPPTTPGHEYVHIIPPEIANSQHQYFQIINGLERGEQLTRFLKKFGNQYVWKHDSLGRIVIYKVQDALYYTPQGRVDFQDVVMAELPEPYAYLGSLEDGSVVLHFPNLSFLPQFGSYLDLEEITDHVPIPRSKLSDASPHVANEYLFESAQTVQGNLPENYELFNSYPIEHINIVSDDKGSTVTFVRSNINEILTSLMARDPMDVFDGMYTGTVKKQNPDGTLQIMPDPPLVQGQGMDRVQIHILPNTSFKVAEGTRVYISFLNSENSVPYVTGFIYPLENTNKLNDQLTITIGNPNNTQFVALAEKVLDELQSIKNYIDSHTHGAGSFTTPSGGGDVTGISGTPTTNMPAPSSVASRILKSE